MRISVERRGCYLPGLVSVHRDAGSAILLYVELVKVVIVYKYIVPTKYNILYSMQ